MDFSEAFLSAVNNSRVDLFEIDPQGNVQNLFQDSLIANIARNVSTSNDTTRCKIRLAYYN